MSHRLPKRLAKQAIFAATMAIFPGTAAYANVIDWTGSSSGGDGTAWTNPLNWTDETTSLHVLPTTPGTTGVGDTAFFYDTGLGGVNSISIGSNVSLGSISFGSAGKTLSSTPLTYSGSAITLYGLLDSASHPVAFTRDETTTGIESIGNNVVLANSGSTAQSQYFNINGPSGSLNFTGVISSSGTGATGITKNGDGNLILGPTNTYTGQTFINSGTLTITRGISVPNTGGNVELGAVGSTANASYVMAFASNNISTNTIDVRAADPSAILTIGSAAAGGVINLGQNITFNGNVNLSHDVNFFSDISTNNTFGQGSTVAGSGIVQTAPTGFVSANLTKTGNGYFQPGGLATYYGTTTVSNGILQPQNANSSSNTPVTVSATYTANTSTFTLSSVSSLSIGQAVAGPGFPLAATNSSIPVITNINTSNKTITVSRAIDPTFTNTAPVGTTLYFGTANPLGLSSSPIMLGDAATTANGYSAALMVGATRGIARAVTVSSNPTTGIYYIGGRTSTAGFSGPITLNQPATVLASTASSISITGGITSGGGAQILTLGSFTTGTFFGSSAATYNTISGDDATAANGTTTFSTNPIADGLGKISVVVNAGLQSFQSAETYSGNTTINGGTLRVTISTAIANTPVINLNGSGGSSANFLALNSTAASPFAFSSSQKVLGAGTFTSTTATNGPVQFNGILQTGETNNVAGKTASTITLVGGSVLNGTTLMDLTDVSQNDQIVFTSAGNATANLGGILTVTNPNGVALAAGQSYHLFSFGSDVETGSFSQINLPTLPASGAALSYNLSNLYTAGTISIANGVTWNNAGGTGDGVTWDTTQQNFNNGAGATTYADGEIVTFNDINNGHYAVSISGTVSPAQLIVSNTNTYTFNGSGGIGGNAPLSKTGTGTLNLLNTGGNSLGPVLLNQGIVNAGPGTLSNALKITINPTGTAGTSADAVTLNSNGSLSSASTVVVNANSVTAIGTLNFVSSAESVGSITGNGNVVLAAAGGTALTIGGDNSTSRFAGTLSDGGTGLGSLTKTGTGIVTLAGTNTYGGGTNLNAGELSLGSLGAIGTVGTINFNGGALQSSASNNTDYSSRFSTAANQQFNIDTNGQSVTFATALNSPGGSLTKSGSGRLTLTVTNAYSGTTTIAGGTLALGNPGALGASTKLAFLNGGILQYAPLSTIDYSGIFSTDAGQTFGIDTNSNNVVFNSSIGSGGSSSLVKYGYGTLTLNQPNNFSGTVQASTGTLITAVSGGFGTAAVTVFPNGASNSSADAVTLISGGGIDSNALVTISNSVLFPAMGIGTLSLVTTSENIGGLAGNGVVSLNNSAGTMLTTGNKNTNTTFSGSINDAGTGKGILVKVGTGTFTVSGNSTFGGGVMINSGILTVAGANALGTGPILFNGGRLQYSVITTDFSSRISTAASQNMLIDTNSLSVTFASQLNSSGGTLNKLGLGTLTLNKVPLVNTVMVNGGTLATTITGGFGVPNFIATTNNSSTGFFNYTTNPVNPILLNVNGAFTNATNLALDGVGAANTVTLNLNGPTETVGAFQSSTTGGGTAKLVLNNSTGTVFTFGNSTNSAIDGTITDTSGKSSVVYVGTGTVTLNNTANNFAGGLTVRAGAVNSRSQKGTLGYGPITIDPNGTSGTSADSATINDVITTGAFLANGSNNALIVNTNSATAIGTLNVQSTTETLGSLAGTGSVNLGVNSSAGTTFITGTLNTPTVFSGNITDQSSLLASKLVYVGTNTFTLSGSNNYGGGTNASAGTLNFGQTASFPAVSNLSIGSVATVVETNHSTGAAATVLRINSLTNNGLLNVNNNAISIHDPAAFASTYATVRAGIANGAFNGTTGITSRFAASDTKHLTTLGVILNDNGSGSVLYGSSTDPLGQFSGTTPALDDTLVKYTYFGDANLDGKVDGSDYSRIDTGFLAGGTLTGWYNGDFNYDGVINGSDYTLMDNAFNTQGAQLASIVVDPSAVATAQISGTTSVPEPTTLGLLATAAAALLGRRRRK